MEEKKHRMFKWRDFHSHFRREKNLEGYLFHPTLHLLRQQEILSLMKKIYAMDAWCFDLPSIKHLEAFKELRHSQMMNPYWSLPFSDRRRNSFFGNPFINLNRKSFQRSKEPLPLHLPRNTLPPSFLLKFSTKRDWSDRLDPLRFDKAFPFDPRSLHSSSWAKIWRLDVGLRSNRPS